MAALDPKPPVIRYARERPGEMIHIDIKKLGRIEGIGHRITGNRTGQRKQSAVAFTARAIDWFAKLGVSVERIMSDNGAAYKGLAFADLFALRGVQHRRTRPYTPRTNGKAERFILREWAYAQPFQSSSDRGAAMLPWITEYNTSRPHCALGRTAPLCRLASFKAQMTTTRTDTVDPKPSFVGLAGVKPREATAKGART
jgi:transposase InsO family protein